MTHSGATLDAARALLVSLAESSIRYAYMGFGAMKKNLSFLCLTLVLSFFAFADKGHAFAEGPVPAPGATITKVGFGSCAAQYVRQPIWDAIMGAKPDFFILMGDNVYGDVGAADMWELNSAYWTLKSNPDFSRAQKALALLPIWDDHDYGLNDGGANFKYRKRSEEIFRDFWKIPASENGEGLYRSHILGPEGKRVQTILLDLRSFRSDLKRLPERGPRGPYTPDHDPEKTMLGQAQWAWLEQELKKPADFRIIVSSIQVLADGHNWERWGNLPQEREKLLALLTRTGTSNMVLLSGDRHLGALYKITGTDGAPIYEVTSSSLNRPSRNPIEPGPNRVGDTYGPENFGMIEFDWKAKKASLQLRSLDGSTVRSVDITW